MTHQCGRDFSRAWRLVMAGLADDDEAWAYAIGELGSCPRCWEYVVRQLTSFVAGRVALQAKGLDNAINVAAQAISEELIPNEL
jgi:hypothetical protein